MSLRCYTVVLIQKYRKQDNNTYFALKSYKIIKSNTYEIWLISPFSREEMCVYTINLNNHVHEIDWLLVF